MQFLSAHTVKVFADVTTQNLPTQPDYMIFNEVGWDAPAYPSSRVGARFLGATTLHDSQVDIFSVHYDTANVPHEIPLETTANNPENGAVVFLGVPTGTFDTVLNVDFTKGIGPEAGLAPCPDLITGGVPGISAFCSNPSTLLQNFRLMSPVAREVVGRNRHKTTLNPGVVTRDIRGNAAPNGQYLTPVGIEYPGMAGIDPRTQSLLAPVPDPNRIMSFYPFGASDVLAWPPADPASIGIAPVEPLALACNILLSSVTVRSLPASPQTAGTQVLFTASGSGGSGSYEYEFWSLIGGYLQDRSDPAKGAMEEHRRRRVRNPGMDRLVQQPAAARTDRRHPAGRIRNALLYRVRQNRSSRTHRTESPQNPGRFINTNEINS